MVHGSARLRDEYSRLLFDEATDGIFVSSPEGVYLEVNRSGHRLLGYDQGELIGTKISQIVIERDLPRLREALAAISSGQLHTQIWPLVCKDGSIVQLELQAQRLSNGAILAVARDLHGRAEFERKVQASEAALWSILHTAPDTIMTVNRQGRILFINRVQPPLSHEQVVGSSCFDYVPLEARERVERAIEHVFTTRTIDEYEVEGPPDVAGHRAWVAVRAGPLIERDQVVAATLCATDVTDRKQAEKARARLEEQLLRSQKMESVGQLAGGVAHDFNNLLTAVLAFVDLTQDELPAGAKAHEYLEAIRAAATRGATLTQQLLAFARKKFVKPEDASLNEILTRMAPMIRRVVGAHIDVELAFAPELNVVKIDVGSMEQVIMNLIVNARDAMPNGGRLTLATQGVTLDESCELTHPDVAPGDYIELSVTDTGTGISSEVRSHLFEPFFTTKPPGGGTGLGLAMCHGIIKQAGGAICVYSEPGNGSSFRIYLPALGSMQPAAVVQQRSQRRAGNETVLVVEDEPLILRVAQAALEKLGYHVLCANNGLQALEVADKTSTHIDLLITDVVMPKLGGRELATRLQALRPGTRVLYTSGYARSAVADHGILRDGVDLIQKPYALTTLAKRVREVLDRK